jgi:hypothetical protein
VSFSIIHVNVHFHGGPRDGEVRANRIEGPTAPTPLEVVETADGVTTRYAYHVTKIIERPGEPHEVHYRFFE